MANVTMIPATKEIHAKKMLSDRQLRRVAGYARVSTESEEQATSFEAQTDYYTKYITANPEWIFVKVYTDEGVSATNTRHREGFNEMIADALAGKIDLIVTKSVSRFARNTVDSLATIRKLKEHGTEVYFEKENIRTFDCKGELLLTIMSSLAQEESRSISENVTWGQRKRFADGKVNMPFRSFLGYCKGKDGLPEIVPEEAETVRLIYRLIMEGRSLHAIANELMARNLPTPRGKTVWQTSTIESILTNEKYKGDALLQKSFTVDFLQKKMKPNEGEVPQYYVENSHPAIIARDEWDLVQSEMARRKARGPHCGVSPFATMIVCGDCGCAFGSKVWHSTDKYRRVIWRCNGKYAGKHKCRTPHITEDEIKVLFLRALDRLLTENKTLIEDCRFMREALLDHRELDAEIDALSEEMEDVAVRMERLISENASSVMDQDDYAQKHDRLEERFEAARTRQEELLKTKKIRAAEAREIGRFADTLRAGLPAGFAYSNDLWLTLIDHATVTADEHMVFTFKNGAELAELL